MKKILVVCAAMLMLPCLPLRAQEAEDTGTGVCLSVIPRLDITPEFNDGSGEFTFGNSSLYTLFEGNITENLSFSVMNHWASLWGTDPFGQETKDLYNNTFWHSDTNNWLDWAYLTYETGDWSFTLGKDCLLVGGIEFDDYDFEVHPATATTLWNVLPAYQWGGKIGYALGEQTLLLQVTASPYGERPFSSGLYSFGLGWNGSAGNFEWINAFTLMQTGIDGEKTQPVLSLGGRWTPSDALEVRLDLSNRVGDYVFLLSKGFMAHPTVTWSFSEKFDLVGTCVFEANTRPDDAVYTWMPGAGLHWYPLGEDRNLRVHATAAYNSAFELTTLSLGVLYNLNLL